MEMELVSREIIKPSSPTPPHLKTYTLSFIDNLVDCNIPFIFFYNPKESSDDQNSKISQLKKSLSLILCKYYIFAGRLKNKDTIECNDQGVSFLVMKSNNKQFDIIQNPTQKMLNPFFPDELQWKYADPNVPLVAIQIIFFACGGMAISICMNHKCGDACTLFNFMNEWSTINKKLQEEEEKSLLILPFPLHEGGSSIFAHKKLPFGQPVHNRPKNNMVCKRFVFQPSMIKFLKEIATSSSSIYSPSRILLVIAWIYKHIVLSMGLNFKTASFMMPVDLRKRMVPPLSEKSVGNIIWFLSMVADKEEMELKDLVFKIKEGLNEFYEVYPKLFGGSNSSIAEGMNKISNPNSKIKDEICFSSLCNFPIYEVDFGWGKPTWITLYGSFWKNFIVLMDTRDGNGIEAVVSLEENYMAKFEHEVKVFQHGFLNPSNVHKLSRL